VGVQRLADGISAVPRLGAQGELVMGQLNPRYYEQTLRGNAFLYSTAAAGVTLAAPSVNSAPMIWNPANSGKNLVLTKVALGYVSATSAAGYVEYAVLQNAGSQTGTGAPVVSLTTVTPFNLLVGSGNASVMRFAQSTVTLANAPSATWPAGVSMVAQTATSTNAPWTMIDDIDGRIIIPPGNAFFVVANAAVAMVAAIAIYGLELPVQP
jgi:hypothetical protein